MKRKIADEILLRLPRCPDTLAYFLGKDFYALGDEAAVRMALVRLVRDRAILRVRAGVFAVEPSGAEAGNGLARWVDGLATIIALQSDTQTYASGQSLAVEEGFASGLEAKHTYLTQGLNTKLDWRNRTIIFRSAPPPLIDKIETWAGRLIQALYWMDGRQLDSAQVERLRAYVQKGDWKELAKLRKWTSLSVKASISRLLPYDHAEDQTDGAQ